MSAERVKSFEYMRGIAMLGVIGIHTGSYYLNSLNLNIHLFALLEIASRFSVPLFFFISAFGLFWRADLTARFDYGPFLLRRGKAVFIPYLIWSLVYMAHYSFTFDDYSIWELPKAGKYLLFGLASYQLYFLVILLWFYALMPLWRSMLRVVLRHPVASLTILLALQLAFNYFSSYVWAAGPEDSFTATLVKYRLSFLPFHYLFIFMVGAVCAQRYDKLKVLLEKQRLHITVFFFVSLLGMLGAYYALLFKGFSPEAAVNTVHQLSPVGVIYTLAAALYLTMVFEQSRLSAAAKRLLNTLARHSFMIYLIHPLVMLYLSQILASDGALTSAADTLLFYWLTVFLSIAASVMVYIIPNPAHILAISGNK